MKILLVDDNISISKAMARFLEFHDFEVVSISDSKLAIDMISNGDYDLVVLDIAMPEMSGFDVVDKLAESGQMSKTKILINTAVSLSEEQMQDLKKKGVVGFNLKTKAPEMFLASIKESMIN